MATQIFHDPSFRPKLRTSKSPLSLVQGEWQTLSNLRLTDQTIRARFGTTNIASIITASEFRGAYVGRFMGVETIFLAVYVPLSTKTRVYKSTDATTWTEITKEFTGVNPGDTSIGPYGTTRLDDDGLVWFAILQDRDIFVLSYDQASYSQDVLVFANQSSFPRAHSQFYGGNTSAITNGSGTLQTAIIEPILPPVSVRDIPVRANLISNATGFLLADASNTTYVNSGANFVWADVGASSTANTADLTIGTSSAAGDTAILQDSVARQLLSGVQLHIGVETTVLAEFLAKVKIEVGNYSGSFSSGATIYEPTGRQGVVTSTLGTNIYLLSFNTEEFQTSGTYNAIRLTFQGGAPSSSRTVKFFYIKPGVALASANPGTTSFAISFFNAGAHTESPGVVYADIEYPKRLEGLVGFEVPDGYTSYAAPASADLQYAFTIPIINPTQAQADKGVEAVRIYRKRPQDADYWLTESYEVATYSETPGSPPTAPVWSFTGSTAASAIRNISTLGREPLSQTTYPDEFHVPMPKSRCGIGTSDRCYVGVRVTGKPNFMFSAQDQPFRFREISDIDPDTGEVLPQAAGALNIQGDQINGFAQVSGSQVGTLPNTAIGVATVYAFGERSVYLTGGKTGAEILSLSDIGIPGCIAPGSITTGRNNVFYLDREGQVRKVFGAQSQPISRLRVDSITRGIPSSMKGYTWGAYYNERYYMFYTPSGGTRNNRILVWSDEIEDWESIDTPPLTTEAGVTWYDASDKTVKLIAFMQAVGGGGTETLRANTYDLDDLDDLGSNITVSGTTFEMHQPDWAMFTVDQISIVADKASSGSVSWTVNYKPDGGSRTSSTSLVNSESYVRREDGDQTNVDPANGASAAIAFSASVPGGWRLYNMQAELESRDIPFERGDATS